MEEQQRIEQIAQALERGGLGITATDAGFLLSVIARLEKKSAVLSHHVLELTEELENVKMDFGGNSSR